MREREEERGREGGKKEARKRLRENERFNYHSSISINLHHQPCPLSIYQSILSPHLSIHKCVYILSINIIIYLPT